MRLNDVKEWVRRRPFEAFTVQTTTGDEYTVRNVESAWLGENKIVIGMFDKELLERTVFIDLAHIVRIEAANGRGASSSSRRKKE